MDIELSARELGIGRDELLELLEIFLEVSFTDMEALEAALAAGDPQEAAMMAHSLKGAALNLGLEEISGLAQGIEGAAKNGIFTGVDDRLTNLRRKLQELSRELDF